MPLVTLTSDIGLQDYLVGAIKGRLYSINPHFNIADITHHLPPFNYPQAAYICRNAIYNFPDHTFHIILINLFDQKPQQLLLCFHNNQYILCADNGFITMILENKPEMVIRLPAADAGTRNALGCAQAFGKAIDQLANGTAIRQLGEPDAPIIEKNHLRPLLGENWIEGQIIFIDNFENVIVNITRAEFEEQRRGRPFQIVFKRDEVIDTISESYADVAEGEKLALFNSAGYLEISINKGNSAGLFGLHGFMEPSQNNYLQNKLYYQTVRVYFV
ncbi:MAG: SAM-dependent chlorinase/fluorinase [Williamsia sp.]|nr:SAM-dependent chlorinase/fluorinase [Williamsia sp.]